MFLLQLHCLAGSNLDTLQVGQTVGVLLDSDSSLHLYIDGFDTGVASRSIDVGDHCHAVVDLYGQCEAVSVVVDNPDNTATGQLVVEPVHAGQEKAIQENGLLHILFKFVLRSFDNLLASINLTRKKQF